MPSQRTFSFGLFALAAGASAVSASTVTTHLPLQVCERLLTDQELVAYFHLEIPDKAPVLVSSIFLHPDFAPQSLGYPVTMVAPTSADAGSAFEVTKIDYNPNRVVVEFEYAVEGLRGRFKFRYRDGNWIVDKRRLWER